VQFERLGYFCKDSADDAEDAHVFNRIVTLRDSWAKLEKQALQGQAK
jgi:glutaminyl-tRNA synthetase